MYIRRAGQRKILEVKQEEQSKEPRPGVCCLQDGPTAQSAGEVC